MRCFGRAAFIRIQAEYPRVRTRCNGSVSQISKAFELHLNHLGAQLSRQLGGSVRAPGIHHHNLVCPAYALDGCPHFLRFIEGDDVNRNQWHGGDNIHMWCELSLQRWLYCKQSAVNTLRASGLVYSKMSSFDLISVVITTYNRSDALALVLEGLRYQTDRHFEVIIADDGSTQFHQDQIAQACASMGIAVHHVWHPDVGFTAAQVRNLGVAVSKGPYLVLMDGDCVPEVDFIARHRALKQVGCFVNGSRVLLREGFTRRLLAHTEAITSRSIGYWLRRRLSGDVSKLTGLLRLPDSRYRLQPKFVWKGIRSCNMAVWKSDYLTVNGFDESFVGWGHEDADFVLRLHNAGLLRKNGFCATEVYHLWHPEASRTQEGVNADKVRQRQATGQVRSTIGYQESIDAADVVVRSWG